MPKPKRGPRTGSGPAHARHMLAGQAADLFVYGRIRTTKAKAKQLRPYAEKLITKAKRGDLHARRQVQAKLQDRAVVSYLFEDVAPRFADRPGGYTRVLKLGPRRGDDTEMAIIELVERAERPAEVAPEEDEGGGLMDRLRSRFGGSGQTPAPTPEPEPDVEDLPEDEDSTGEPEADADAEAGTDDAAGAEADADTDDADTDADAETGAAEAEAETGTDAEAAGAEDAGTTNEAEQDENTDEDAG